MFRWLFPTLAFLSFIPLALGFMGHVLPLGESLSVFRLPNIIATVFLTISLRRSKLFYPSLIVIITSIASVGRAYIPMKIDGESQYRIYQKNLYFRIADVSKIQSDILSGEKIDFLSFQEVSAGNSILITQLAEEFPYKHSCTFASVGGTAVMSRWPIIEDQIRCYNNDGITAMEVETPSGPLWLVSIHLQWPYPYGQAKQVKRLLSHIEHLDGRKLIAGDFNMVPWSHTLSAFEKVSDTKLARPSKHTLPLPYIAMPISIDHVLLPKGSTANVSRRDRLGSDHYGLLVDFNMP